MAGASKARKIAIRMTAMLNGYLSERLDEERLVVNLLKLAADIEGARIGKPPAKALEDTVHAEGMRRVFAHWQRRMSKPRAKLTEGRKRAIRARMKDGYTIKQMKQAIDACCASEWHMGDNDRTTAYNDLTIILRSGEKLEQFMAMGEQQGPTTTESPQVRRLLDEAADAMQRGDTAAYNDANTRLKEARN